MSEENNSFIEREISEVWQRALRLRVIRIFEMFNREATELQNVIDKRKAQEHARQFDDSNN